MDLSTSLRILTVLKAVFFIKVLAILVSILLTSFEHGLFQLYENFINCILVVVVFRFNGRSVIVSTR